MFGMLDTILNNLFSKPATRMFPKEIRPFFKGTRGSIDCDVDRCIFCSTCVRKCPADALMISREDKTWTIDPYRCVICGICVSVCPVKCIVSNEQYAHPMTKKEFVVRQKAETPSAPVATTV